MKKKLPLILIILIILIGFWVRFYRLNLNFPSLYADEVGGLGYSLFWFSALPIKNLLLKFLIPTSFFGLTPLGVRLPSAVFGTLFLILIYWLAKEINFEKKKDWQAIPLVTLILAAFLPWGIHLSRIGHVFVILSLIMVGVHWLIYLKAKTIKDYFWSLLPLILAAYFYPSIILIAPLAIILVLFKIWQLKPSVKAKKTILIAGIILIALSGWMFSKKGSYSRGFDLAIWKDVNVTAAENIDRGLARLSNPTIFSLNRNPELIGRLFYNRPMAVINTFTRIYLSFYSTDFLFLKGDPTLRHSTGRFGIFYPFLMPFLIYGTFLFFIRGEKKAKEMFLFWLLVSPIPAALAKGGDGYLLRVTYMLPLLTYLSALGLVEFLKLFKSKLKIVLAVFLFLLFSFSTCSFLFNYFHVYPAKSARSFEYGFKELADWQKEENFQPLLVIWDGYYPCSYFGFWQPTFFKNLNNFTVKKIAVEQSNFYQGGENLYFSLPRTENDLQTFLKENKISFLALPGDLKESFNSYQLFKQKPIKIINYPDQTPAFYLYQYPSTPSAFFR
jgi:hypothetical protein